MRLYIIKFSIMLSFRSGIFQMDYNKILNTNILRIFLFAIFGILAISMFIMSFIKVGELDMLSDFNVFWQAGKDFSLDNELYYWIKEKSMFVYPPFAAFVFQVFTLLPMKVSGQVFFIVNAAVLLPLCFYLIYKILVNNGVSLRQSYTTLLILFLFTANYNWNNQLMFQSNLVWFSMVLAGIYYVMKTKPEIGIIFFTAATFIKILPVFLVIYVCLVENKLKVWLVAIATVLFCLLAPMPQRGFTRVISDQQEYYNAFFKPRIAGYVNNSEGNFSIKYIIGKIIHKENKIDNTETKNPALFLITMVVITLLAGMVLVTLRHIKKLQIEYKITIFALLLLLSHLASGITWTAHLVSFSFILLPLLLIDRNALQIIPKIILYILIAIAFILGVEGSDTTGEFLYHLIRNNGIFPLFMLSIFFYYMYLIFILKEKLV